MFVAVLTDCLTGSIDTIKRIHEFLSVIFNLYISSFNRSVKVIMDIYVRHFNNNVIVSQSNGWTLF